MTEEQKQLISSLKGCGSEEVDAILLLISQNKLEPEDLDDQDLTFTEWRKISEECPDLYVGRALIGMLRSHTNQNELLLTINRIKLYKEGIDNSGRIFGLKRFQGVENQI